MKELRNFLVPLAACALLACGDGGSSGNPNAGDTGGESDADVGIGTFDVDGPDTSQPDTGLPDGGDVEETDTGTPDSGDTDVETDAAPVDADSDSDAEPDGESDGETDDADTGPDTADGGPSLAPPSNPTSVAAGGAVVSSTGHRGRILIGGTQPAGRLLSTNHQGFIAIGTPLLPVPAPSGGE